MLRALLITLLAVAAAATLLVRSASSGPAALDGPIVNEPVLVWDTTGSAFAGTLHRNLIVYNSGFVAYSKRDDNPFGNLAIDVRTADIGPAAAQALLLELVAAGALALPDQNLGAADLPLKTLTLLQGKELALSRTISYWAAIGGHAKVDLAMQVFVEETFPGF